MQEGASVTADTTNWLRFDVSPAEARDIQRDLAPRVVRRNQFGQHARIRTVAGADISLRDNDGYAAVIVYSFPELCEIERASAAGKLRFPYVPGLLSFRELPLLLEAFGKLQAKPDLILVDGHGLAHPRRFGLACFLGLALDRPTIGCGKSLLVGKYTMPASQAGSTSPLTIGVGKKAERVGTVLRTRAGVSPLFISIGHRISLRSAVSCVLKCCDGYRLPKPQREADLWTKQLRRS